MQLERLGPYKLEKLLGRGGMGAVYVGLNEATGERAAVKLLSAHLADDPPFRERFKQEIETLKRLRHPNIVQLHGFGEEEGYLYYVMELIDGRSLQDELLAGRRFHWREVTRIGIAIAQALKHAHDRGIIHRDLKPGNLLIDAQDHVKLADFGIAKLYGGANVTAEGGMLGTADYMAPEQATGKPVTGRCDLYSLGSVLYALLTGRPPFAAATMVEVIAALQNDPPASVRSLSPEVPQELDEIILQLLDKDPQHRFPTALALANRLRAMEHALSLETRVDSDEGLATDLPRPEPTKTEPISPGSRPTEPLSPASDEDILLPGDEGTLATGVGGPRAPSSRTELGTQAAKKTGAGSDSGRGTHTAQDKRRADTSAVAAQPKTTQFTTVNAEDQRPSADSDDSPLTQWAAAAVLAIVGLAAISATIYFATRPPTADQLYSTVKAAADRGGVASLEGDMLRFLQLYPNDPRAEQMKEYLAELEQNRIQRRLKTRSNLPAQDTALTPIERAYQSALVLVATDPQTALDQFVAILAVYGDAPSADDNDKRTAACLELTRQQITKLRSEVEHDVEEQRAALQRQLDRADSITANDPAAAQRIWQGIVTLYAERRWAKGIVESARQKLVNGKANPAETTGADEPQEPR